MALLDDPRHELFAQRIARGKTQLEAYRLAGYAENDSHASALANEPHVKARVSEIVGIISARAQASAERVLAELARIGFADITQAVEIVRGKVKIKDTAAMSADIKGAISEIRQGRDGVTVKVNDKGRALELLGKHLGLFKENINIDVNISLADLVNGSYKLERGEPIDVTPAAIEHQAQQLDAEAIEAEAKGSED